MSDQNPYSTPDAELAVGQATTYEPKIFSFAGRIGRLRYLAYSTVLQFGLMMIIGAAAAILAPMNNEILIMVGIGAFYIVVIVFSVMFAKRRLNDLNRSGWWFLLFIIPLANILMAIYLIFFPGTEGPNDFGPAPIENSLAIKILGFIFPFIFIVGIVAAVAIPAYQDYVTKAQQSTMQQ